MSSPYSVLEVGEYVAVPYAGKLLSGVGAEVLKIEPPEGDIARRIGPFHDDNINMESSGFFAYLNTGKRSITLAPYKDNSADLIHDIVENNDIDLVIEDSLEDFGVDPIEFCNKYDSLNVVSITAFGSTGPWQEFDVPEIITTAESGQMNKMGYPNRPPTRLRIKNTEYMGGQYGAFAGLAALYARDFDIGEGQYVDVSKREAGTSSLEFYIPGYSFSGEISQRTGNGYATQGDNTGFPTIFPAKDGYFSCSVTGELTWKVFCTEILEKPELAEDERFNSRESIAEHSEAAQEIIESHTTKHGKWELLEEFQAHGIASSVTSTPKDIAEFNHLKERDFWQKVPLSNEHIVTMPGFPLRLNEQVIEMKRPPKLGEHNSAVYGLLDRDVEELRVGGMI